MSKTLDEQLKMLRPEKSIVTRQAGTFAKLVRLLEELPGSSKQ